MFLRPSMVGLSWALQSLDYVTNSTCQSVSTPALPTLLQLLHRFSTVQHSTVQCGIITWYSTVQYCKTARVNQRQLQHCSHCCNCYTGSAQYSTVQYSVASYHCTVQYSTVQYCTVQYSTVQCSMVQYSTVLHSTLQGTVQYSTAQYSTVQCSVVQYSTVLHNTLQGTMQYSTVQ